MTQEALPMPTAGALAADAAENGAALSRPESRTDRLRARSFQTPDRRDRPGMRWWWQSPLPPEALVHELRTIAQAGFGEVEIALSPGFWADAPQRDALRAVLEEAACLDIGVAVTLGAAWPLQTPNTSRGTVYASQELQYGARLLSGQPGGLVEVPLPFDDEAGERGSRLLGVSLARVIHQGTAPTIEIEQSVFGERRRIRGASVPTVLDAASLADISSDVVDGRFSWDGRDGNWVALAYWMRDSEQGVTSFLDRAAALAATRYLDENQFDSEIDAMLREIGTDLFEDSLELDADSLFWTPEFAERFRDRYGYDILPLLPGVFAHGMCRYWVPNEEVSPDFAFHDGTDARVRKDYHRFLTDLYIADHLQVLQEWSMAHGVRHKAQVAYGQNLEAVRSNREFVRMGGHAEAESLNSGDRVPVSRDHPTWRFALDWQRSLVAGAHQGGAVRISTELGAQFQAAYSYTLGDYRRLLDKEWAAGITKPFIHGYASQEDAAPWPGQHRFWDVVADSWNTEHYPEWSNWRPLTDYWARGTVVLETGVPRTDVAVYRDGFLTTAARGVIDVTEDFTAPSRLADTEALETLGYSVQFVDPLGIAEVGAVGPSGTLFPHGPAYRALVLDNLDALPATAAEAIDAAAASGLRVVVVGEPPHRDDGYADAAGRDARVVAAVNRLLARENAIVVDTMPEVADALLAAGIRPRAEWPGAPLLAQLRETPTALYLVVYNTTDAPISTEASIEVPGSVSELELWTGDIRPVESTIGHDGRTRVPLELAPLGLRAFEIERATGAPAGGGVAAAAYETDGAAQWAEVAPGPWSLHVSTEEPDGSRIIEIEDAALGDWRDDAALRDVSGIGVYRTQVAVPPNRRARVDLGALAGSAVVRAGGRRFGPAYVSGETIDIDDSLAGDGVLEIEVRTALRNAVAASGRRAPITGNQPQGLIGPVRIFVAADSSSPESDVSTSAGAARQPWDPR